MVPGFELAFLESKLWFLSSGCEVVTEALMVFTRLRGAIADHRSFSLLPHSVSQLPALPACGVYLSFPSSVRPSLLYWSYHRHKSQVLALLNDPSSQNKWLWIFIITVIHGISSVMEDGVGFTDALSYLCRNNFMHTIIYHIGCCRGWF